MTTAASLPLVNVVVRTFNEEDWIGSCLSKLNSQTYKNFVVSVVDSGSKDRTLDIVGAFSEVNVCHIEKFLPGASIAMGLREVNAKYTIILSAHCLTIEDDYISTYVSFLEENPDIYQQLHNNYVVLKINVSDSNENEAFMKSLPPVLGYPHMYVSNNSGKMLLSKDTAELLQNGKYSKDYWLTFLNKWSVQQTVQQTV